MVKHVQFQRPPAKAGAQTSPYFDKRRALRDRREAALARGAARKHGSATPARTSRALRLDDDEAIARAVGAMCLQSAPREARRSAGFIYLDDLAQLAHMCGDVDRETGAAAGRVVELLATAGTAYSEMVCAHACCGEDAGWLEDISEPGARPQQTVAELGERVKTLLGKIGGELGRIERVFRRCLAADPGEDADAELETELWLERLARELATARFGGASPRADPKTICAVFNKRDHSYLEVNCPVGYCEEAAMRGPTGGHAGVLYGQGAKTAHTIRVLQELGARYIADDRQLFVHRHEAAAGGELRSAHVYATEELLFVWLDFV